MLLASLRTRAACTARIPLLCRGCAEISSGETVLTREELLSRIKHLESRISRLQEWTASKDFLENPKRRKLLDFSEAKCRFVALKIAYLGWKYSGYQMQANTNPLLSIEGQLRVALDKVRLVEHPATAYLVGASRTDAGVSALDQVVKVCVRSRRPHSENLESASSAEADEEFNYVSMLNYVLPSDIRVLAWAPVTNAFNPRMDPLYKTYWYFFQRANLDIDRMRRAARDFIGKHNFQNFCVWSLSNGKMKDMVRTIDDIAIDAMPWETLMNIHKNNFRTHTDEDVGLSEQLTSGKVLDSNSSGQLETLPVAVPLGLRKALPSDDDLFVLKVRGRSFLYRQIRCMAAALFAIGCGVESDSLIRNLLNVGESERKVHTDYAPPESLFLHDVKYEHLSWRCEHKQFPLNLRRAAAVHALQLWNVCTLFDRVSQLTPSDDNINTKASQPEWLGKHIGGKYRPVLERPRGYLIDEFKKNKKKDKKTKLQHEDISAQAEEEILMY